MPRKTTKASHIAGIRRRIAVPFSIRGTLRKESFSTRKALITQATEIPIYFANPLYKMHSREWVERLHATVHAATARAVFKFWSGDFDWSNIESKHLPVLMVFGPDESDTHKVSGKNIAKSNKAAIKHLNPKKKFIENFDPHR